MKSLLNQVNLARLRVKQQRAEAQRWSVPQGPEEPRVFYGMPDLPSRRDKSGGGIIKCIDLAEMFPNTPKGPNLLYLVSSALPLHADVIIDVAKRRGVPFVLNQNGVAYPGWHGIGWEETNRPLAHAHKQADHVVYQSTFCQKSAELFLGKRTGPSSVHLNPVNLELFCPSDTAPPSGPVLLCAGSHEFPYRLRTALETLALLKSKLPEARLVVAGRIRWGADDKAAKAEFEQWVKKLKLQDRVEYVGPYTQDEAPALFQRAHLLLHTKFNDPCPRLIAEALACGLPVVYSATGGSPEIVGGDAGRGVPGPLDWDQDHPPEPSDLAAAVDTVWVDYADFAAAARRRAEEALSVQPWIEAHREIFKSLTRRNA